MKPLVTILMALSLMIAACDQSQSAGNDEVAAGPQGQEREALPSAAATAKDAPAQSVTDEPAASEEEGGSVGAQVPQSDVPPPSRAVFTDAECNFEAWVGKNATEAEAAAKETGRPYRILKPDSMMTMDHSPERINIEHGDDGTVTRVWCG